MAYVEIKKLEIKQNELLIQLPDFSMNRNDFVWVQAPSGFGKTTLLRAIAGLTAHTGEIYADGVRIDGLPIEKRNIGFVFQDHLLFSHLSAIENVMLGLKLRGMKETQSKVLAAGWMKKFDLGHRQDAAVTELSGGERQRIAFLRALIWEPKMLLLDEPFKGLDEDTRGKLMVFLRQYLSEHPTPVICVSHQPDFGTGFDQERSRPVKEGASLILEGQKGEPPHARTFRVRLS